MAITQALASSKADSSLLPSVYYSNARQSSKPGWLERPEMRRQLFQGLALVSGASLVRAAYVGYTQSTKTINFYKFLGVCVVSFIVALRCLPFARKTDDHTVAKQLRKKTIQEIESSPDLKFSDFFRKYKELLERGILEPSDARIFLERDVVQLDYIPFIDKHAGGDLTRKQEIIQALSPEGQERLRAKCRIVFALEPSKTKDPADKELLKGARNPNQAALLATDWDNFIRTNSVHEVKDPQAIEALKILFLEKAYLGENSHSYYLSQFPKEAQEFIHTTLSRFEFALFLDGKVAFGAMVWNRDWTSIKACLEQIDPTQQDAAKEKLRQGYLGHLSYEELNSDESKEMRTLLGITPDMIENRQGSVRSDAETLTYLGDDGLRKKYGNKPLKNSALLPVQVEKIKKELQQELPTTSQSSLTFGIWEDLKILGIHDEILRARFEKIGFAQLWEKEKTTFFADESLQILGIEVVKSKLIKDLAEIPFFQILKYYSDLFPKYLQPSDIFRGGKTFAECAAIAVALAGDLFKEVVPYDYYTRDQQYLIDFIPRLFEKGLLLPSSPALRGLLRKFFGTSIKEILEYNGSSSYEPTAITSWRKIRAVKQIFTAEVQSAYETALTAVTKARAVLKQEKEEIQKRKYQPSEARTALEQKLNSERKQLGEVQEQERKMRSESYTFSSRLPGKASQLQDHKQRIYAQYSALEGLPQLQTRLQVQIAELEKASAPDTSSLAQLSQRLSEMRISLQKQEQEYEKELEKLPKVQEKIKAISEARKILEGDDLTNYWDKKEALKRLQEELKNYIQYSCPVPEALAKAREELRRCEEEQARLIQSLEVQTQKPQALDEFKNKEQAIASQMEKCRKNIPVLESDLPALQAEYDKVEQEEKARVGKEKDLRRQIQELESSVKKLEAEASKDPEREKFNNEVSKAIQEVDVKYKTELQKQIETFINKVAPEETAAAV